LFGELEDLLNKTEDTKGIEPPFSLFHGLYGDFIPGNCYGIAAGFGDGKSTFLDYIAKKCVLNPKNKCKVLYLDTELSPKQNANRFLACMTKENEYVFQQGSWKDDPVLKEKVLKNINTLKKHKDKYHYKTVEMSNAKDLISIIRRWCNKYVEEDEIPLIVYDYMKITGEKVDTAWNEYNLLGEKTNALHQLSRELGAVVLFAAQTNKEGRIASSNRINWFVANMYSLRSKTPEEIQEHGEEFGTHILTATKTRQQGKNATGFNKWIKVIGPDGKAEYKADFLNFKFEHFSVEEKGSYKDILDRESDKLDLAEE
jgi:predicted ATP-dependent serine protease